MSKHTPAPWKAGPVFNREGRALFYSDHSKPGRWQRRVDDAGLFPDEDAARIAACVNACEGISNELLSHGPVCSASERSSLQNRVEELTSALRELLDAVRTNVPGRDVTEPARQRTADEVFAIAGRAALSALARAENKS